MPVRTLSIITTLAGLGALALALLPFSAIAQADGGRPVTWNTYLGGGLAGNSTLVAQEELEGVITSRFGEVYVTGKTNASAFPQTLDGAKPGQDQDIVITRLSTDGGVLWSRVIGGANEDVGKRIAFFNNPSESHLLVAGSTASSSIRDGGFPVYGAITGLRSGFLLRVELDGRISWFTYLPGSGNDEVQDLSVHTNGPHAYITGHGAGDAFLTKVNIPPGGSPSLGWAVRFGTADSQDVAYAVDAHPDHTPTLLYVGGRTGVVKSGDSSIKNVLNSYGGGDFDGFIAKFDPTSGLMEWFRYMGGNRADEVRDLLNQPTGGTTIIGNTLSTNYPPLTPRSGQNIFLGRLLDVGGTVGQETLVGAGGETMLGHASSDNVGNIYFGGSTVSTQQFALRAFDPEFEGGGFGDDGFIAMADRNLQRIVWASYVGGSSSNTTEAIRGVSAVPYGQLTFVGTTSAGSGVMVANRGADLSANGNTDGIIFRLPVDQRPPIAGTVQGRFTADNKVVATWTGFLDEETDIDFYRAELLAGSTVLETDDFLPYNTTTHTFDSVTNPAGLYHVRVVATDLFDYKAQATGPVVKDPPDAGMPDGGSDGGGGSDAGTEVPQQGGDPQSPVGWGCGSAGGGTLLGVVVLMLALSLLARRRAQ
jgi:hypothetical protein